MILQFLAGSADLTEREREHNSSTKLERARHIKMDDGDDSVEISKIVSDI